MLPHLPTLVSLSKFQFIISGQYRLTSEHTIDNLKPKLRLAPHQDLALPSSNQRKFPTKCRPRQSMDQCETRALLLMILIKYPFLGEADETIKAKSRKIWLLTLEIQSQE